MIDDALSSTIVEKIPRNIDSTRNHNLSYCIVVPDNSIETA